MFEVVVNTVGNTAKIIKKFLLIITVVSVLYLLSNIRTFLLIWGLFSKPWDVLKTKNKKLD